MKKQKSKTAIDPIVTYATMSACAGSTGIPLRMIKAAKRAGCPDAFHSSGRVHLGPLLHWFFRGDVLPEDGLSWDEMWRKYRALTSRLEHDREAGRFLDRAQMVAESHEAIGVVQQTLCDFFRNEIAPKFAGLSIAEIHGVSEKFLSRLIDRLKSDLRSATTPNPHPKNEA